MCVCGEGGEGTDAASSQHGEVVFQLLVELLGVGVSRESGECFGDLLEALLKVPQLIGEQA